ncbi:MAG TPA: hypothetical protein VF763_05905 [Candidatus Limnocylindrales bacterium]
MEPPDDAPFRQAVERICADLRDRGLLMDACDTAGLAEHRLRADGYPTAIVDYHPTVADFLAHTARWSVRRDGLSASAAIGP